MFIKKANKKKGIIYLNKKEKQILWKTYKNKNYFVFIIKGVMGVAIGHLKMSFFKILANVYIFFSKSIFKLFISQIRNMISGVNYGYFIDMFLKGIGYRLWFYKNILFFNIGYTHLVQYKVVENVLIRTLKNQLIIFAINNILLNTIAYDLVKIKSPDIYRGKGVRFVDRDFKLKLGKQR